MKAAVARAFNAPLAIEEVDLAPPGPGEVEIRIRACAICHSDLMFIAGAWGGDLPAIWGHEAAGEVIAAGEGVDDLQPGDRVALTLIRSCGGCACCQAGQRTYCTESFPLSAKTPLRDVSGAPVTQGLKCAAFAERAVAHRSQLAPIGERIGWAEASLLACGVITGHGAVTNTAKMPAGARAVVIGAGGVGLNAVQGAALSGASPLIAVDISATRLETAREFGATHCVKAGPEAAKEVKRILGGGLNVGADYVFVTVGSTEAMGSAYRMLAPGGAAVLVGMAASGELSTFDPLILSDAGRRIIGSKMGSSVIERDIPALVRSYLDGRLKLDELVTGRFALHEINEALDRTRAGIGVRNVILFD
ncbi:MAG: alcohol dehydrogenase catalytic domain-containing protein [Pikeienuella sp.]